MFIIFQTTVRRLTATERERQLQNFCRQEEVREDTLRQLGTQKLFEANMNNEEKLSEKRYIRQIMMEQKEREMEDTILKVSHYLSPPLYTCFSQVATKSISFQISEINNPFNPPLPPKKNQQKKNTILIVKLMNLHLLHKDPCCDTTTMYIGR